jgi:hypothetical protein
VKRRKHGLRVKGAGVVVRVRIPNPGIVECVVLDTLWRWILVAEKDIVLWA